LRARQQIVELSVSKNGRTRRTLFAKRPEFHFETTMGNVDLLGEVSGGGTFEQLKPFAERKRAFGVEFFSVTLDKLILLKRAAGRPKDFEMVARLEVARQEKIAAEQSQSAPKRAPG